MSKGITEAQPSETWTLGSGCWIFVAVYCSRASSALAQSSLGVYCKPWGYS